MCLCGRQEVHTHTHPGREREKSELLCKVLATEGSRWSRDGSLLSYWCTFSRDSKVFKLNTWKVGEIIKETPICTLQKQYIFYMNQNSSWGSLVLVQILEDMKTQRIQNKQRQTQKNNVQIDYWKQRSKPAPLKPRAESSPGCQPALAFPQTQNGQKPHFPTYVPWFFSFGGGNRTDYWNSMEATSTFEAIPGARLCARPWEQGVNQLVPAYHRWQAAARPRFHGAGQCPKCSGKEAQTIVGAWVSPNWGGRGPPSSPESDVEVETLNIFRGKSTGRGKHSSQGRKCSKALRWERGTKRNLEWLKS